MKSNDGKEQKPDTIVLENKENTISENTILKAQELYIYGLSSIDKVARALKIPRELVLTWCKELNWDRKKKKFMMEVQREIHQRTKKRIADWVSEMDKHLTLVIGSVMQDIKKNDLQIKSVEAGWNIILKAISERLKILQIVSSNVENSLVDIGSLNLMVVKEANIDGSLTKKIEDIQQELSNLLGDIEEDNGQG